MKRYFDMFMDVKSFNIDYTHAPDGVMFCCYKGKRDSLLEAVREVDEEWVQYFSEDDIVYCGITNGEIASFCIIDNDVNCIISDGVSKIGSIGCVGTRPKYRNQGIGLYMIESAIEELKKRGMDKCFIHYTDLVDWYGKLGFEVVKDHVPTENEF